MIRRLGAPARAFGEALRFLTAMPVPGAERWLGPPSLDGLGRSLPAFTAVGWALGGLSAGLALALWHGVGPTFAAVGVLALWAAATLGLHLDGVADSADALFSGRPRARKLEILKDSRIGAMGAIALVLVMLGQWSGLAALGPKVWMGALLAPVFGRLANLWGLVHFPVLEGSSLGRALKDRATPRVLAIAAAIALVPALIVFGPHVLWILALAWFAAHAFAAAANRSLGGLSGDLLGAMTEIAQLATLVGLAAAVHHGLV